VVFIVITLLTTLRSTGSAHQRHPRAWNYRAVFLSVSMHVASNWMRSHRLQLNTAKTEIIWLTTGRRSHLLPQQPFRVGSDIITPVLVVRDLGIYIDADISMRSHVMKTTSACLRFYVGSRASAARYLGLSSSHWCRVRCYRGWTIEMQCWLAFQCILYCLQSVMNAATRLAFASSKCDHITALLRQLHWLKVPWRIDYKLAVLVDMSSWPGAVIPR